MWHMDTVKSQEDTMDLISLTSPASSPCDRRPALSGGVLHFYKVSFHGHSIFFNRQFFEQ